MERGNWAEAAKLRVYPDNLPWQTVPWAEAVTHFAKAIGSARSGDAPAARRGVERLAELEQALSTSKEAVQVKIQRLAATAWANYADGRRDDALSSMRAAADLEDTTAKHPVTPGPIIPARELLGDLLLEMKQPQAALAEFDAVLVTSPNRFGALSGAAHSAELLGDKAMARKYYEKLAAITAKGDRPGLSDVRAFLAKK